MSWESRRGAEGGFAVLELVANPKGNRSMVSFALYSNVLEPVSFSLRNEAFFNHIREMGLLNPYVVNSSGCVIAIVGVSHREMGIDSNHTSILEELPEHLPMEVLFGLVIVTDGRHALHLLLGDPNMAITITRKHDETSFRQLANHSTEPLAEHNVCFPINGTIGVGCRIPGDETNVEEWQNVPHGPSTPSEFGGWGVNSIEVLLSKQRGVKAEMDSA